MEISKAKKWLRLDDFSDDDELIQDILKIIEEYFKNSITNYDIENENMMRILQIPTIAMLVDLYENRSLDVDKFSTGKTRQLIQSALLQAEYCYPRGEKNESRKNE
jgi:hypothetical protein